MDLSFVLNASILALVPWIESGNCLLERLNLPLDYSWTESPLGWPLGCREDDAPLKEGDLPLVYMRRGGTFKWVLA